ncbi:MAG: hypothetical protein UT01_C0011G0003 [Candidatus Daviesbacteria bacterium GW2011_GWA1_38_7]|nr:MAG: hypothetical protein UT01_C0011G0003 [Candidatus Daviesbacteria bacterium GW2011_GWA1_38_7]
MDDFLIFKNFELIRVEDETEAEKKHLESLLSEDLGEEKEIQVLKIIECYQACLETAAYCLSRENKEREYIDLLLYFAEVCQISVELLLIYPEVYELTRGVSLKTGKLCLQQTEKLKKQVSSESQVIFNQLENKCREYIEVYV